MNAPFSRFLGALAVVSVVLSTSVEAAAPSGRYTISGGTVFDTKTKLTWQQTAPAVGYAWAAAKTYCQTLSLGGTGWRLPTMKELQSIVDYSSSRAPFVDPSAFPAQTGSWSSSLVPGSPTSAWAVSDGTTFTIVTTALLPAQCVR
jgi:formylglycine-generating enzyme required for sulfatase activity